jgi:hypothetical protein
LKQSRTWKPYASTYGAVGEKCNIAAERLNASGSLPWSTDRKHTSDRMVHLLRVRRQEKRESARSTGADDEPSTEKELLLDEILESDSFNERQRNIRDGDREREIA